MEWEVNQAQIQRDYQIQIIKAIDFNYLNGCNINSCPMLT